MHHHVSTMGRHQAVSLCMRSLPRPSALHLTNTRGLAPHLTAELPRMHSLYTFPLDTQQRGNSDGNSRVKVCLVEPVKLLQRNG